MSSTEEGEFALIRRYFQDIGGSRFPVALSVGDDCAVLKPPAEQSLCFSIDTLVEGVHFPIGYPAQHVATRALGSALSDLAAMGASPAFFSLALTIPKVNHDWLASFSASLDEMARRFGVCLVGGDTTKGPLTVSVQVHGWLPHHSALCRKGACSGDSLYVSGTLGDAGAGLSLVLSEQRVLNERDRFLLQRFHQPEPRLDLGFALRGLASSCIDVSDGLLADARHLCACSGVGLEIDAEALPLSAALQQDFEADALSLAMTAGDDYELLFTVPAGKLDALRALEAQYAITCIGRVVEGGAVVVSQEGQPLKIERKGYDHFV